MTIPYFIYQTPLGQRPRHVGRVLLKGTCGQQAVVDRMLAMGSSLTRPDITAVLQLLTTAVGRLCEEGYRVDLEGLVKITPTLGGVFEGKGDSFQAARNKLYLTAHVSKALNQQFGQRAKAEKVLTEEVRPVLATVADSEADPGVAALTPGHIVSIQGVRLKFNSAVEGEGLKLVSAADSSQFVTIPRLHKNTSRELVFRLPESPFSEAFFELTTSLGSQTLRVGRSREFSILP